MICSAAKARSGDLIFSLDVIPKVFIGGPSIRFTYSSFYLSPPVPRFHELSDLVSYVRARSSSNLDFFDWCVFAKDFTE